MARPEPHIRKQWTPEEEERLIVGFSCGRSIAAMASELRRSEGGVRHRLRKLGLGGTASLLARSSRLRRKDKRQGADAARLLRKRLSSYEALHRGMFYVYAIVNRWHQLYVGYTADITHRLTQHNADNGAVATKGRGSWHLFWLEMLPSKRDAMKRESQIIRNFEHSWFLELTYNSRKAILEELGEEFLDHEATLANQPPLPEHLRGNWGDKFGDSQEVIHNS